MFNKYSNIDEVVLGACVLIGVGRQPGGELFFRYAQPQLLYSAVENFKVGAARRKQADMEVRSSRYRRAVMQCQRLFQPNFRLCGWPNCEAALKRPGVNDILKHHAAKGTRIL